MKVRKAVIPAAGFGTRFLPATKSQPKEMLPIVDTPTIQYVVEECVESGITDILMVIGKSKRAIEEHFYRNYELEDELRVKGKKNLLEEIEAISNLANIHLVWQKELNGLGDAVMYGRSFVGNEPFALLLGDTILGSNDPNGKPITKQMIDICETHGDSVVALEEVAWGKVERYGIGGGDPMPEHDGLFKLNQLVEKPSRDDAPSNLAIAGRYVFVPELFDYLADQTAGKNGEIQLTDAMARMMNDRAIYGLRFDGKRYDMGNKLDFLKTNIEFGLKRDDVGPGLREYIKRIAADL